MEMNRYIKVYDGDLDGELCDRLIYSFEQSDSLHQPNGRGIRAGLEGSAWTELDVTRIADPSLKLLFRRKIDLALSRYNHDVRLPIPIPNSPRTAELILKRYRNIDDEGFQLHFDSLGNAADRYLVFLWYLNNVSVGGETEFPELGIKIPARRGRLLMFPPYWMFQHAGLRPRSESKYILSTYLLFGS